MRHSWWLTAAIIAAMAGGVPAISGQEPPVPRSSELSRQDIAARVKADAARRFGVRVDEIQLLETDERTWPDAGLGCTARRGVLGSTPVSGFRFVAAAGSKRLTYHTDRSGRLLRCAQPTKPLDPIK